MIRFRATKPDGKTLYGFGITAENVKKLKEKKPINFEMDYIEVIIFYGATEGDLLEALKPFIGPDTEVQREL